MSSVTSKPAKLNGALLVRLSFNPHVLFRQALLASWPPRRSTARFELPPAAEAEQPLLLLSVAAADGIFGPRLPPQAFIIKPGTQVSFAKVSQRTGFAARSVGLSQVENPHLHPHFLPFFHHRGENDPR